MSKKLEEMREQFQTTEPEVDGLDCYVCGKKKASEGFVYDGRVSVCSECGDEGALALFVEHSITQDKNLCAMTDDRNRAKTLTNDMSQMVYAFKTFLDMYFSRNSLMLPTVNGSNYVVGDTLFNNLSEKSAADVCIALSSIMLSTSSLNGLLP